MGFVDEDKQHCADDKVEKESLAKKRCACLFWDTHEDHRQLYECHTTMGQFTQ